MNVLVTGGAGYIGSHVVYALLDAGHDVVVLDNLSTGVRANVAPQATFIEGDIGDVRTVEALLIDERIDAVMHFAGSIVVPESVEDPLKYYDNNTARSRALLEACVKAGVERFIFSSTAAVYGIPEEMPVTEATPTVPINPYGRSKLMTEWMLEDIAHATSLRYVALRYFNVAGADPLGRTGQSTPAATHLIKVATQTALGAREQLTIFGTDYPTDDGTCVRDYIHVTDLARAHVLALEYLGSGGGSTILNCGYGHGFSVRDVIAAVTAVHGESFKVEEGPRRAGDPPALVANSDLLRTLLHWIPAHDDLEHIVGTAYAWERSLTLDT
jgi:UDP-glucose 4-epimerase